MTRIDGENKLGEPIKAGPAGSEGFDGFLEEYSKTAERTYVIVYGERLRFLGYFGGILRLETIILKGKIKGEP